MKQQTFKFLIAVVVLAIICFVLQIWWNVQLPEKMKLYNGGLLLGSFVAIVTSFHLFLLRQSDGTGSAFIRNFMASTVFKFFLYMSVLIGFLLYSPTNKQTIVLHFLFYYAVFTILEVSMLYSTMTKKGK
jgi:hypothetical protein